MMKDEIRAQKERVKQMSRWERFKYFWYYQWKWVARAVAVIAFLCYLGFTIYKNSFEEYVYVALVNCDITASRLDLCLPACIQVQKDELLTVIHIPGQPCDHPVTF